MNLTNEDIERLAQEYKSRLKNANRNSKMGGNTLSDMQDWMIKNNVESPELLNTLIKKVGPGHSIGKKKMSTLQ